MARLLILTPQLPFPPHQGTTIRNFNLIAGLAPRHDIDLLSLVQPTDPAPAQTPLPALCRQVIALPAPPPRAAWRRLLTTISTPLPDMALRLAGVRAFQDTLLNLVQTTPYAVLQVEGIEMAPYVTWLQRQPAWASARQAGHLRLVFDDHNAETILQQRTALADLRHPARWAGAAYSWCNGANWPRTKLPSAAWPTASSPSRQPMPTPCAACGPTSPSPSCPTAWICKPLRPTAALPRRK